MSTEVSAIRKRELEVFNAFTGRALEIISGDASNKGTLADACKLVDTALKAAHRDGLADTESVHGDDVTTKKFIELIAKAHPENVANESA